jgi:hypothetical protein
MRDVNNPHSETQGRTRAETLPFPGHDSRLIGMPVDESSPHGQEHDSDVEPNGPMFNVVEIIFDPLFQ